MKMNKGFTHQNFLKKISGGFTLIELLVVVAIIGILASVVLASLNTARAKGADASIKANLANIRAQAELAYDEAVPNSYATVCTNATVAAALAAAASASGGSSVCNDDDGAWAASVPLKTDATKFWCVDSLGTSKQAASALGTATVCPA